MKHLLIFLLLAIILPGANAQQAFLFVKKGGKKKETYLEGDRIKFGTADGRIFNERIIRLKDSMIVLTNTAINVSAIKTVYKNLKPKSHLPDAKTMLLIGAGSALVTGGLTLSKQAKFGDAAKAGIVLGYGPLLVRHLGSRLLRAVKRKSYRMGDKFQLQLLDLRM